MRTYQAHYVRRPHRLPRTPLPHVRQRIVVAQRPRLKVIRHRDGDVVAPGLRREGVVFPVRLDVRRVGEVLLDGGRAGNVAFREGRGGGEEGESGEEEG